MSEDLNQRPEQQKEHTDNDYAFLQETIKGEQMNGRKFFQKGLRVVCYGFLFGAGLILGAAFLKPVADDIRHSSSGGVSIDYEESISERPDEEDGEDQKKAEPEAEAPKEKLKLNADNYMQLYRKLKNVKQEAEASLADVSGYSEKQSDEAVFSSYGCVLAENTRDTFLVTTSKNLGKAKYITVEFFGGELCEGLVVARYDILDLAVIVVPTSEMSKTTRSIVKPANLGTSAGVTGGDPVVAMGNIYGFTDSVGYGMIQGVTGEIQKEDGVYYRIATDIRGAEGGSGILLNLQGDVIGIVSEAAVDEDRKEMISGIGITDLKPMLEFLLNGNAVPYIGITGTDVTEETAQDKEMPEGVYVQSVSADSPAMNGGVKNGDILTMINGESIVTLDDYHRALMNCEPESEITAIGMRLGKDGYVEISFKIELK